jgi:hypothetical protein
MNCPVCASPNAYLGFAKIECVSEACPHYSADWAAEVRNRETRSVEVGPGVVRVEWGGSDPDCTVSVNTTLTPANALHKPKRYRSKFSGAIYWVQNGRFYWESGGQVDSTVDAYTTERSLDAEVEQGSLERVD